MNKLQMNRLSDGTTFISVEASHVITVHEYDRPMDAKSHYAVLDILSAY